LQFTLSTVTTYRFFYLTAVVLLRSFLPSPYSFMGSMSLPSALLDPASGNGTSLASGACMTVHGVLLTPWWIVVTTILVTVGGFFWNVAVRRMTKVLTDAKRLPPVLSEILLVGPQEGVVGRVSSVEDIKYDPAAFSSEFGDRHLRSERRSLDHVPIERQIPTTSGGVHMADSSSTVPLTLMDRVKSALGMETKAEHTAQTAEVPGLGHVVDKVPVKIVPHEVSSPSAAAAAATLAPPPHHSIVSGILPALQSLTNALSPRSSPRSVPAHPPPAPPALPSQHRRLSVESVAQNASLAPHITAQSLIEQKPLTPISTNKLLAPLVRGEELQAQKGLMHHVPLERVELKRDLAAGVGQVTTRKATPRSQLRGSIAAKPQVFTFNSPSAATASNIPAQPVIPSAVQQAIPSPRLPTVAHRAVAQPALQQFAGSPRTLGVPVSAPVSQTISPRNAEVYIRQPEPSAMGLDKLPPVDAMNKDLWTEEEGAPRDEIARDPLSSREQFAAIQQPPQQETMME
jgi:hypothetical protein